jgi:hypothetical protein
MNIQDDKPRIRVRAGTAADIKRELTKASDHIADLLDVTDAPAFSDMFNVPDHGNRPRTPTGMPLASSGKGAESAIQHYSPDTQPGNSIAQAYDAMASQLAFMNTRMAASEAAIKSIATWLAQQAGVKSFLADETTEKGDESDERKGEGDEDENTAKSIPTLSVPGLMRTLSGASRDTGTVGLRTPPDLAVVKARRNSLQDILDADDGRSYPAHARMELASIQAAMSALDGGQMRDSHLNNLLKRASPQAREALVKANIVF